MLGGDNLWSEENGYESERSKQLCKVEGFDLDLSPGRGVAAEGNSTVPVL